MSASMRAPRQARAGLCVLTTVVLINVGSIVQAAEVPSYCAELKQVAALALARDKFASVIGALREGNFRDSKIALPGWGRLLVLWNADLHLRFSRVQNRRRGQRRAWQGSRGSQILSSRQLDRG